MNLANAGTDAFIIGEHFMRQKDVTKAIRELRIWLKVNSSFLIKEIKS